MNDGLYRDFSCFDEWSGAQQADEDAQRQRTIEAWQRIKSGLYTDRDIDIIEYELRAVL